MTLFLVTFLRHLRLPKIDFGTFQLGIAQLVPRVSGSPSPPLPPIDWKSTGAIEKNIKESEKFPKLTERVPAGHKTSK